MEDVERAIAYARRWLSLDPLHEPAHQALMRLYDSLEGSFTAVWQNEAYQRLAEASRRVVDPEERLRLCREADRILVEKAPTLIATYPRLGLLVKPWVTRIPLSATGGTWWKDTVIEPH